MNSVSYNKGLSFIKKKKRGLCVLYSNEEQQKAIFISTFIHIQNLLNDLSRLTQVNNLS